MKEHTFYKIEGKNWRDKKVTFPDKRFAKAYKSVPECRLPARRGGNAISFDRLLIMKYRGIKLIVGNQPSLGHKVQNTWSVPTEGDNKEKSH